ncbi:MAG TPA: GNAT family N-acetyltransferase [Euzebyales bacterium]|nr:GNAT family N-acetyltransferase [Euzebyales bacterium]
MDALHHRTIDFERRVRAALATTACPLPFGRVVISDDFTAIYDQNLIEIDSAAPPHEVRDTIERVASDLAWQHRNVEITSPAIADQVRATLLAAGYREQCNITMALDARHCPTPAPVTAPAAVVDVGAQLPLARALLAEQPSITGDVVLDQFEQRERRLADVAGARAVVAPPDAPVSRCLVLTDGAIADIDAVGTLSAHRAQGWSTAVMWRAMELARADGLDTVLVADDDDWPRSWYERLGFREIGRSAQFQRWTQDAA